jgi:hypothetical protein
MIARRRSYPLGALFVLVTTCAVLAVGVAPLARAVADGDQDIGGLLISLALGAVGGLIVGNVIGMMQFRVALGLGIGALAGTMIGAVAGALAMLPVSALAGAAGAMTGGSALIVVVALVMRRGE